MEIKNFPWKDIETLDSLKQRLNKEEESKKEKKIGENKEPENLNENKQTKIATSEKELALIDINIINYNGSIIASTAIMLAMKKFNSFEEKEFENKTGYNKKDLENCAKDIKLLWGTYKNERNLTAVKRKFSHNKFFEVSKIKYES